MSRPSPAARSSATRATGSGPIHRESRSLPLALPVAEMLTIEGIGDAAVVAGDGGLQREVRRVNVAESSDAAGDASHGDFLLIPAVAADMLTADLISGLAAKGVAGLGVELGPEQGLPAEAVVEAAERASLPLLCLAEQRDLTSVADHVVASLLDQQAHRLARSEQIHTTLSELVLQGHGLSELCAELSALMGVPTAIVDADGRFQAWAQLGEIGLSPEAKVEILGPDRIKADGRELAGVTASILAGIRSHGHVVAVSEDKLTLAQDRLALQSAATVAALAIAKDLEIRAVEDKYRSDLMHELLFHLDDREDALRRASSFGWDLQRRLIVLVVRLDDPPEVVVPDEVTRRPALAQALRQLVLERDPKAAVVEFNREVVILTAAFDGKHGRADAGRFARRMVREVSRTLGATVSAGQSRPVEDLEEIRTRYVQASAALEVGREVYGRGTVQHFLDLGTYRLLSQVHDPEELEAFAREVLSQFWSPSDEDTRSLLETLQALIEENCNVAAAARRLHFHYNTLRHRAAKLEEIVGPFLSDHRVRLDVEVALLIRSMKGLHLDD